MKLKVEYLPIDEIKPYENNAKIHTPEQIEQIKASIQQFGMNDPIGIWSKDNIIIEGHGRLMACKELNRKCYMMELDPHYISVIIERYINFTGNDVYRLNPDGTKTNWRDIECEKEKKPENT